VVVDVDLRAFGGSALTDDVTVPKDRTQEERAGEIPVTYVPARNTIFLSLALAYAETLEAQRFTSGPMCWTIPVIRIAAPILSTRLKRSPGLEPRWGCEGRSVEVCAPLLMLSKAEIVQRGQELRAPLELTHSCYDPGVDGVACGRCDSCRIRREGFRLAGVVDPVPYAIL
jgi:7-cyano-7-deazaguanine synthase